MKLQIEKPPVLQETCGIKFVLCLNKRMKDLCQTEGREEHSGHDPEHDLTRRLSGVYSPTKIDGHGERNNLTGKDDQAEKIELFQFVL